MWVGRFFTSIRLRRISDQNDIMTDLTEYWFSVKLNRELSF